MTWIVVTLLVIAAVWRITHLNRNPQPQTCWVWCPKCGAELTKDGSLIEDTDLVRYECSHCGHKSGWDFDAPVPILIEGKVEGRP